MRDLIERIRADREAGTPGDWEVPDQTWSRSLTVNTAGGLDCTMIPCSGSGGAMSYTDEVCTLSWTTGDEWLSNARRIARVPTLERCLIDAHDALQHLSDESKFDRSVTNYAQAAIAQMEDAK